jgi:hypothetical protein
MFLKTIKIVDIFLGFLGCFRMLLKTIKIVDIFLGCFRIS